MYEFRWYMYSHVCVSVCVEAEFGSFSFATYFQVFPLGFWHSITPIVFPFTHVYMVTQSKTQPVCGCEYIFFMEFYNLLWTFIISSHRDLFALQCLFPHSPRQRALVWVHLQC